MKNKTKAILCTVAVAGVVGISGILAYLTDTDTATNNFTVGKVEIELQEPTWDAANDENSNDIPDVAETLAANATIAKDPQVQNIGKNDAYVYLKVTVPKDTVIVAQADGTRLPEAVTELFSYEVNEGWTEIPSQKVEGTDSNTYVYYYNEKLAPDAVTAKPLFNEVTLANVIEGEIDLSSQQIDIDAYAIQSDNLPADTTIEGAYTIYVNQNK